MPSFGENLTELRKSRGYSQDKFAKAIGSNQVTVSSWEVGTRMPALSTIQRIADTFHVPLSSLIALDSTGKEEDADRELLDLIKSKPMIRELVDKSRYLIDDDIRMLLEMINALTRTRV